LDFGCNYLLVLVVRYCDRLREPLIFPGKTTVARSGWNQGIDILTVLKQRWFLTLHRLMLPK